MKLEKMLITSIIILALMAGIGCVEENAELIDDYNAHMDTYNKDYDSLNSKLDAYNSAYSMALADEDLTSEEVEQLSGLANDYIGESEYVISRLNDFKDFITLNEQDLKYEEIETQSFKSSISDDIVTINQNVNGMKSDIEETATGLIDDYNTHMDTYNKDIDSLNSKINTWDSAVSMADADEYLTSEEVEQLSGLARDYIDESEYVISRSNDFKDFINLNEQDLKYEGVETQSSKTAISDDIVTINQNVNRMISDIEEMIQIVEDTEDLEELEAILDLFI